MQAVLPFIGKIIKEEEHFLILLDPAYAAGLKHLDDFSYLKVIWWMDGCDCAQDRKNLIEQKPYKKGPEELGVFATRSPMRPNPIGISNAYVTFVDEEEGVIGVEYIDADDGSPVLDLKPYIPSIDTIEKPYLPNWCKHWPSSYEKSGEFDWDKEFNF